MILLFRKYFIKYIQHIVFCFIFDSYLKNTTMLKDKFTVEGLKNDPKLRLELYELMLIEWEKPFECLSHTGRDFTIYLQNKHGVLIETELQYQSVLPELFENRPYKDKAWCHHMEGEIPVRNQRVIRIEKSIKDVKNLLNIRKGKYTRHGLLTDPKIRLELYKDMIVSWEKPIKECFLNHTQGGFCCQLYYDFNIDFHESHYRNEFKSYLPELYKQRKIKKPEGGYHYLEKGVRPEGREQRVAALKQAIKILESKPKYTIYGFAKRIIQRFKKHSV